MSYIFSFPHWIKSHNYGFTAYEEIPDALFDSINVKLDNTGADTPTVSVVIAAWNEEVNILNCISSLADIKTKYPFEIIVVNNNSTDKTQQTLDRLHIKSYFQPVQGCGPARQMGLENAKGQYVLLADADCIYPGLWIDKMLEQLTRENVVCVYGRYSFIPSKGFPRWKLFLLEKMKDAIAEVRHHKRPYLNAFGMSMGFVRKFGIQVGFVFRHVRGEDGRLCFDLMQFGKVKQVKSADARVWTPPRTLQLEGGFMNVVTRRIAIEAKRFTSMFKPHPPHDTKTSENE